MTSTDDNMPPLSGTSPEPSSAWPEQKEPEGFDPKKLNITLVFAAILAILLMWYLSAKLF